MRTVQFPVISRWIDGAILLLVCLLVFGGCNHWAAAADVAPNNHILASVKKDGGCSAQVVGDPEHFREYQNVLVVSAAHCVAGRIGGQATFFNPDGETKFQGTLIAFDRSIDVSLFVAPSKDVLGAVPLAEQWDDRAKWATCSYPGGRGPNFKWCVYSGGSDRIGATNGELFRVDATSRENGGVAGPGHSGGGMLVLPTGKTEFEYFGVTSHGTYPTVIATTKHKELAAFIDRVYQPACDDDDCPGGYCPPRRRRPGGGGGGNGKPDWWKPNVPGDEVAPPPPGDPVTPPPVAPPVVPEIVNQLTVKIDAQQQVITELKGQLAGLQLRLDMLPHFDVDKVADQVIAKLPPVRMVIRKAGRDFQNEKPLGEPLIMEFIPIDKAAKP